MILTLLAALLGLAAAACWADRRYLPATLWLTLALYVAASGSAAL